MKKHLYIALATLLGIMIGMLLTSVIETWVINDALMHNQIPNEYQYIGSGGYLHPLALFGLLALGTCCGLLLGHVCWRIVYIENHHWLRPAPAKKASPAVKKSSSKNRR